MNKPDYQRQMEDILAKIADTGKTPSLLLHSCCAPCSSSVMERLTDYFDITVYYYNPNISPEQEYVKRKEEQKRLLALFDSTHRLDFLDVDYDAGSFDDIARGLENEPEGGRRCLKCYELRLRKTAETAKKLGFDFFGTTLSVSPYKNAAALNTIGDDEAKRFGVSFLTADFKKKNGYLRSIQLSKKYGLYRQNFCGCRFSKR